MARNVWSTCEQSLILNGQQTQHEQTCNHMNEIDCKITGMYTIITTMISHMLTFTTINFWRKAQNINLS